MESSSGSDTDDAGLGIPTPKQRRKAKPRMKNVDSDGDSSDDGIFSSSSDGSSIDGLSDVEEDREPELFEDNADEIESEDE
jgi:hypothetical protein